MKRITLICLVAVMALMQSCKDECKDVNCNNGGSCLEGICQCLEGFSGTSCQTRGIDAFIGSWTGNNVCGTEMGDLVIVEISEVAGSDTDVSIVVDGGDPFEATVSNGVLDIPEETFEVFGIVVTTSGSALVDSDGALVLDIDTIVDGDLIQCTFTGIN